MKFSSNLPTMLRGLLIIGFAILMLTAFSSCSHDAIVNPRNQPDETEGDEEGEDPNEDPGGLSMLGTGETIVFLS